MSKSLQALEDLRNRLKNDDGHINIFDKLNLNLIEKYLKALEIIKEKEVNVQEFKLCLENDLTYELCEKFCQDNNEYEEYPPYNHSMTREEYDLIKEILND